MLHYDVPPPASATRRALRPGVLAVLLLALAGAGPKAIALDIDGDGKPDAILLYQGRAAVTVRVRFADASKPSQSLHFAVDSAREDAVCRLPVNLEVETLRSGEGKGVRIVDGACDSIHIFFNRRSRRLGWWRL